MSPSSGPFIPVLKALVRPYSYRKWDHDEDAWLFHWHWLQQVVEAARRNFEHVDYSQLPTAWQMRAAGAAMGAELALDGFVQDPFQTLHVTEDAPWEVIKAAYKALAAMHHPDAGGDRDAFERVDRAYRHLAAVKETHRCEEPVDNLCAANANPAG
jgi:hypothetical protein